MLAAARALLTEPEGADAGRTVRRPVSEAGWPGVRDPASISQSGVTLVLVEQNVRAALTLTNRALVLVDGKLAHDGPTAALHDGKLLGELFLGHRTRSYRMNPQAFIDGLIAGSTIGLGAIGLTLAYSILRFANFTHGDFLAWGAYLTLTVAGLLGGLAAGLGAPVYPFSFGWGLPLAMLGGVTLTVALALGLDRILFGRCAPAAPM
jgi:hypothetical protein